MKTKGRQVMAGDILLRLLAIPSFVTRATMVLDKFFRTLHFTSQALIAIMRLVLKKNSFRDLTEGSIGLTCHHSKDLTDHLRK